VPETVRADRKLFLVNLRDQHGQSIISSTAPIRSQHGRIGSRDRKQRPEPGLNPGEGVPGAEPGGLNRARDSAALHSVQRNNLPVGIPEPHP
jgi:hypothetical protein